MKATGFNAWVARFDSAEHGLCLKLNRAAQRPLPRRAFQIASRLGNGVIWYALLIAIPLLYGPAAIRTAFITGLMSLPGIAIYSWLKRVCVRERPFITHSGIDKGAAPLDRYSFPSGHTIHAVSFAWQVSVHWPELAWVVVPLAALIAASRVVLGLHYPTDVLAGAAIGAGLAQLGLSLT